MNLTFFVISSILLGLAILSTLVIIHETAHKTIFNQYGINAIIKYTDFLIFHIDGITFADESQWKSIPKELQVEIQSFHSIIEANTYIDITLALILYIGMVTILFFTIFK